MNCLVGHMQIHSAVIWTHLIRAVRFLSYVGSDLHSVGKKPDCKQILEYTRLKYYTGKSRKTFSTGQNYMCKKWSFQHTKQIFG